MEHDLQLTVDLEVKDAKKTAKDLQKEVKEIFDSDRGRKSASLTSLEVQMKKNYDAVNRYNDALDDLYKKQSDIEGFKNLQIQAEYTEREINDLTAAIKDFKQNTKVEFGGKIWNKQELDDYSKKMEEIPEQYSKWYDEAQGWKEGISEDKARLLQAQEAGDADWERRLVARIKDSEAAIEKLAQKQADAKKALQEWNEAIPSINEQLKGVTTTYNGQTVSLNQLLSMEQKQVDMLGQINQAQAAMQEKEARIGDLDYQREVQDAITETNKNIDFTNDKIKQQIIHYNELETKAEEATRKEEERAKLAAQREKDKADKATWKAYNDLKNKQAKAIEKARKEEERAAKEAERAAEKEARELEKQEKEEARLAEQIEKKAEAKKKEAKARLSSGLQATTTKLNGAIKKLLSSFKKVNKETSTSSLSMKRLFKQILRFGLGIGSIYVLFNKLRGAIKEGFSNMAKENKAFKASIDKLKGSLTTLKNSFAAAFYPIVNMAIPYVQKLIDYMVQLMDLVSRFAAAALGQKTYMRAIKQTGNAAEKASKQLSGLDNLNTLSSDNGTPKMFEEVAVDGDEFQPLIDSIKDIASKIFDPIKNAWSEVSDFVISSWKHAGKSIIALMKTIGNDFLRMWDSKETQKIFEDILTVFGDIGELIGVIADKLQFAWKKNDRGYKILCKIRDIFGKIVGWVRKAADYTVAWANELDFEPLMQSILDWLTSLEPVIDAVYGIMYDFYTQVLLPLSKWVMEKGLPALLKVFQDFNDAVDWDLLRDRLSDFWDKIEPFAEAVGQGLIQFIDELSQAIADFVNSETFGNILDAIGNFLSGITADDVTHIMWAIVNLTIALNAMKLVLLAIHGITTAKNFLVDLKSLITSGAASNAASGGLGAGLNAFAHTVAGEFLIAFGVAWGALEGSRKLGEIMFPDDAQWYKNWHLFGDDPYSLEQALRSRPADDLRAADEAAAHASEIRNDRHSKYLLKEEQAFQDAMTAILEDATKKNNQTLLEAIRSDEVESAMQEVRARLEDINGEYFHSMSSAEEAGFMALKNAIQSGQASFGDYATIVDEARQAFIAYKSEADSIDVPPVDSEAFDESLTAMTEDATEQIAASTAELAELAGDSFEASFQASLDDLMFGALLSGSFDTAMVDMQSSITGSISEISSSIHTWAEEGIEEPLKEVWDDTETWLTDEGLPELAEAFNSPDWKENVRLGFEDMWSLVTTWWSETAVPNWWEEHVLTWFSADRWNFPGIADGLSQAFTNAVDVVKSIWNDFAKWLNDRLELSWDAIDIKGENVVPSGNVSLGHIPAFATGGVVPPYISKHLAIVGDNNTETEVISPLSTMKEAMIEALEASGVSGNSNQEIVINLDGREFLRAMVKQNNDYKKQHNGLSAF